MVQPSRLVGVMSVCELSEYVTTGEASQVSATAVGEPVLDGRVDASHWIVVGAGHVNTGFPVSMTVII
jgi:hypothetical protein